MTEKINEEIKKTTKTETKVPDILDIKARKAEIIEKKRLEDKQPVRGLFKFFEIQGGNLEFSYNAYKGEPNIRYNLRDGETVTIPRGVARHLNTSGWWPIHEHSLDDKGRPSQIIGRKVRRYAFFPTDFVDVGQYDNQNNNILQVNQL